MPTNANTFNSRVTSEALEKKFRDVFPAQGGAELVQDLFASGVIQPVIDFSSVAEGSVLAANLQTAWDFASGNAQQTGVGTTTVVSNPGFWLLNIYGELDFSTTGTNNGSVNISDGISTKPIWRISDRLNNISEQFGIITNNITCYLRAGDSLTIAGASSTAISVIYRQIADVNGNLVNPLGFTSS
jgi:hypothetical protein